jgi:hypothetical protein
MFDLVLSDLAAMVGLRYQVPGTSDS